MPLYSANGGWNVTVVDGTTRTGIYAADGSYNVVKAPTPVTKPIGAYHPCGAWYVTVSPGGPHPRRAPDGSLYVTETKNSPPEAQYVVVVAGSLA